MPILGALIDRLDLLITNDSGPAHIAYARTTPCVTIFGSGDPARYGPPPGPFAVVIHPSHDVKASTVEDVVAPAESLLTRGTPTSHGKIQNSAF
ncbi:MAG: glycosyltransferase family 9 protein [Oscillochloris sp.]|nr:glycosyltransferase family 9 protein [Oscillochloris sp.]